MTVIHILSSQAAQGREIRGIMWKLSALTGPSGWFNTRLCVLVQDQHVDRASTGVVWVCDSAIESKSPSWRCRMGRIALLR
jgi:hypothetical protein